jgi:hypothetical protein
MKCGSLMNPLAGWHDCLGFNCSVLFACPGHVASQVCAPTGAGKTNIAMVAVLRELGQNMRHGVVQKADFKIVYVAPMKVGLLSTMSRRGKLKKSMCYKCRLQNN